MKEEAATENDISDGRRSSNCKMTSVMEAEIATENDISDKGYKKKKQLKMPSVIKAETTENDIGDGRIRSN